MYLVAVMDWHSRYVLSWELSNTMDRWFCVDALHSALAYQKPEVFNTDQGAQFTSEAFIDVLKKKGIQISMDGKGRCIDNVRIERLWRSVKYEDVFLRQYASVAELHSGLTRYFHYYNTQRPHQALGYLTPDAIYYSKSLLAQEVTIGQNWLWLYGKLQSKFPTSPQPLRRLILYLFFRDLWSTVRGQAQRFGRTSIRSRISRGRHCSSGCRRMPLFLEWFICPRV